jgi:hypothetical protein
MLAWHAATSAKATTMQPTGAMRLPRTATTRLVTCCFHFRDKNEDVLNATFEQSPNPSSTRHAKRQRDFTRTSSPNRAGYPMVRATGRLSSTEELDDGASAFIGAVDASVQLLGT